MRNEAWLSAMVGLLVACGSGEVVVAQPSRTVVTVGSDSGGTWVGGAPVQTDIVVGADGETFVGVWIDAPSGASARALRRPPMSLSLVVDTSGSMAGPKIQNARLAAQSFLENVADGDIVSVFAFANGVSPLAPPTVVGPATRNRLMQSVSLLRAGGGTNLHGGVDAAIASAGSAPATHPVRRVVLISDGHANIGPSDPGTLGILAAQGTERAVQVSAIGVGLDYDENTLGSLAVQSSGRLYHLEQPFQLASILESEVRLLASTIATDAVIEIVPAPGVTILEGVSRGAEVVRGRLRVPLGSVFAGQRRDVLFKARVDTSAPGARALATANLVFRAPGSDAPRTQSAPLRYAVTADARAAARSEQPRVRSMVSTYRAAEAQRLAAVALNEGNRAEAERQFEEADRALSAGEAVAPAPQRVFLQQQRQRNSANRRRAQEAASPAEARGAALDSYDAALEAEGY